MGSDHLKRQSGTHELLARLPGTPGRQLDRDHAKTCLFPHPAHSQPLLRQSQSKCENEVQESELAAVS